MSADPSFWQQWHEEYDNPDSALSWRVAQVRTWADKALDAAFAATDGPVRVLSLCAGDGRDVLGVLEGRTDTDRVRSTLIELDPDLAAQARARAEAGGFAVDVRTTDAGTTEALVGAVPAEVVLLCGIFGNISHDDLHRTIAAVPMLCAPGARVLWTRGRAIADTDPTDQIRAWFAEAGCTELDFVTLERGHRPSVGLARFDGEPRPLDPGVRLFAFGQH